METPISNAKNRYNLNWKVVSALLALGIVVLLLVWRPWQVATPAKTISVRGEATVSQVPDAYYFNAVFQADDAKAVTATGNDAVARLKQLGVAEADIKTSFNAPQNPDATPLAADSAKPASPEILIYPYRSKPTYGIQITVKSKDLAQKVSDYLTTTKAVGTLTPQAQLSKEAQASLGLQARAKAADDAKAKAGVMAKQLGAKLGKVVSISEDGSTAYRNPELVGRGSDAAAPTSSGPIVSPGTSEVSYGATVVFQLK